MIRKKVYNNKNDMHILLKKIKLLLLFSFISVIGLAQSGSNTAGGQVISEVGSVSFTIGQVFYHEKNGLSQGVQQPAVNKALSVLDFEAAFEIYPNPVSETLFLKLKNEELNDVKYELVNLNGQIVLQGVLKEKQEKIKMSDLKESVYVVNFRIKNKLLKSIKIIKTK